MKIVKDNEISIEKWQRLLDSSPFATPFQSPHFLKLVNSAHGQSAKVFAVEEQSGITALAVITILQEYGAKAMLSKRAIIYGGPVFIGNQKDAANLLLKTIERELGKKVIYLETRNAAPYTEYTSVFTENGWNYLPYLNIRIDTEKHSTPEAILGQMTYNRRREIRLSLKHGATLSDNPTKAETVELYEILKNLYHKRVKRPLPGRDFFLSFRNNPVTRVIVVKHNNRVIGGAFCTVDRNAVFTLYYIGLKSYHKKIYPNSLLVYGAIDYALRNRIKTVDLMGAGKAGEKYGVRNFKSQFGGNLYEPGRFIRITKPLLYRLGVLGITLLSKLKK